MRQKSSLPWDLLEAALLSLLTIELTLLPHDIVEFSAPLGIVLVIFLPGYSIILALFPRASDLAIKERMLLSLVASAIVAVLTALCLSIVGEIMPSTFASALAVISLALITIAYIRWAALPSGWRFIPSFGSDILPAGGRQGIKKQRRTYIILLSLAAVIIISAYAYSSHTNNNANTITIMSTASPAENGEKKFTEFYILDESSQAPIEAGSRSTIMAGIINREHRTVDYTLRLVINDSILSEKSIKLNHNNSWEGPLSYTIGSPVNMQRLDLLLYKDGNFQKPYDERNIWINVSGQVVTPNKNMGESSSESEPKDLSDNSTAELQHNEESASDAINSQNSGASPIEENKPETEEAQPQDVISNTNSTSLSEQEKPQQNDTSENLSEVAAGENSSPKPLTINTSGGNKTWNFSSSTETMNVSDADQEAHETNATAGSPKGQENIGINRNPDSNLNNGFNGSFNINSSSSEIEKIKALVQSRINQSKNNFSINKSMVNPYATAQKFYTRPKPGSTTPDEPTALETNQISNTSKPEVKSGLDSNGIYKIQSAVTSGTDKSGSDSISQTTSEKTSDKSKSQSNKNIDTPNETSNNVSADNTAKINSASTDVNNKVNISANKSANNPKNVSPQPKTSAQQDIEGVRMAEMSQKIDSWVKTRGMNPSKSSNNYKSDIIQFNGANNSVALGGQSAAVKKLG